jgi:uncharacterized membrane protein YeaQ/YmgE (transglycosylase-associated protein family)
MTLGLLIYLALGGFVVGGLARLAVPGPDPMPWWATILLGVAGMWIGGVLAAVFLHTASGFILSLVCAVVLLTAYRKLVQKRPLTGPGSRLAP